MNKSSKKLDLLLAFGINIIFFVVYTCFFELLHETNDDLALSFLVEGAYGERTEYLVYQNVLWGKLLIGLYSLIPAIKWYNILMYLMLFLTFLALTYVFIRVQGRKMGLVSSTALLLFCGYYSYVVFQYSRIAPLATAGGLILLFYAIEHAQSKVEKTIGILVGALLAVWGSMLRFQMFALAVVLVGGVIGLYKVWQIVKEKQSDWVKQIGTYVLVFGTVGALSLLCYVIDGMHYSSDEEWSKYQEFNKVRTELWDYGFPDYEENQEAYESVGISENDYNYYLMWNMDEEVMTIENLQVIADAKPEKTFDALKFFSIFPKNFLGLGVFVLFLVLSVVAIWLNRKNVYFVLLEFAGIMVFEAYFFYINRYAIIRIDTGMWMTAIVVLLYAMSDDLAKLRDRSWKIAAVALGLVTSLFVADYCRTTVMTDGVAGSSKAFYEEVEQDEEHLYIMLSDAPKIYYALEFWEPCELGEFSNVYNIYGWEFNVKAKKAVLEEYGIENIYRDSIDNEEVYFVTGESQSQMLENYIIENYDANASLVCEKVIDGVSIWSVHTAD